MLKINLFYICIGRKLFSNLGQVIQTASTLNTLSPSEGKVVYELQFQPHQAKLGMATRTTNLMNRLNRLELLLGTNQEKMVSEQFYIWEKKHINF